MNRIAGLRHQFQVICPAFVNLPERDLSLDTTQNGAAKLLLQRSVTSGYAMLQNVNRRNIIQVGLPPPHKRLPMPLEHLGISPQCATDLKTLPFNYPLYVRHFLIDFWIGKRGRRVPIQRQSTQ